MKNKKIKMLLTIFAAFAFIDCSSLKRVVMDNNIKTIGDGAFYGCKNLNTIKLSDELDSISEMMFSNCTSLEKISIPSKVQAIGESSFISSGIKEIVLGDAVSSIGEMAFAECNNLEKVTISNSLTDMGESIFDGDVNLKEILVKGADDADILEDSGVDFEGFTSEETEGGFKMSKVFEE